MIYDSIIIGTGPAGISAALNLKINNKRFLIFGSENLSEKIIKAENISNYPGLCNISGNDFQDLLKKQISDMGIQINNSMINNIMNMGDRFAVLAATDYYECKSIILTTGVDMKATILGEKEFLGRGVSYCATCDGNLYKDKTVAVYLGSQRFLHEALFLSELARKVYLFANFDCNINKDNTEQILSKVKDINGDTTVNSISLTNGNVLNIDGIFILRETIALNTLIPELKTEQGHINVNRDQSTNIKGIFAAGDCTGRPYQYAKAVGEGNVAAHSCVEYLNNIKD